MPDWLASMTAGSQLAGAVPEVARSNMGRRLALAMPTAKNAALRSSTATWQRSRGWRSMARASGVEREPGEMIASVAPAATKPATMVCDQQKLRVPVSVIVSLHGFKRRIVVAAGLVQPKGRAIIRRSLLPANFGGHDAEW